MTAQPTVVLCTLVLNEAEWLPRLYEQHRDWPGLLAWVFVEAADAVYAETNPDLVSPDGLSVDGTTDMLASLAAVDPRVVHVRHGFTGDPSAPANGKCAARQRYLDAAEDLKPDYLVVLDADEFYVKVDQRRCLELAGEDAQRRKAYCFRYRHPWRPPSVLTHLFRHEVVGGFWDMRHCHFWRWEPGLRYSQFHMTPETASGEMLTRSMTTFDEVAGPDRLGPQCVHMAFASDARLRRAKHRYYADRGEAVDKRRRWYVDSRAAWEAWVPGAPLPRGARVVPYSGPIPEVFR